jgi:hypothetical protein
MARIELRDSTIRIKDGLSGTGIVNEATPGATDTAVGVDGLATNRPNATKVPVGARFTVDTAGNVTKYTVTARTLSLGVDAVTDVDGSSATAGAVILTFAVNPNPLIPSATPVAVVVTVDWNEAFAAIQTLLDSAFGAAIATYVAGDITVAGAATLDAGAITFTYDGTSLASSTQPAPVVTDGVGFLGTTPISSVVTPGEFVDQVTDITFSPAWGTPTPVDDAAITWLPIEVEVKIGDGNLTYTENIEYEYELDRGILDTVKKGDDQPMDVNIDFVYEFVTTGTGESITPVDALKGIRGAAEFTSSSADPCEPYSVDLEVDHDPGQCSGLIDTELTLFPDFRYDSLEFDIDEATIAATGRCNAEEPTITRVTPT